MPFDELSLPELTGDFLFKDVSVACDAGLDVRNGRATKLAFFNNIILTVPQGNSLADFSDLSFDERSRRVQMAATAMKVCVNVT